MTQVEAMIRHVSVVVEAAGVAVILAGAVFALATLGVLVKRGMGEREVYRACRTRLGRGILLGLEFLVAADIINTVAVQPTFRSVGVLAVIIAIRSLLSLTPEVEMTGRWPWQRGPES